MPRNQTSFKCGPNGPARDYERARSATAARDRFGLGPYDGRYEDRSEEILSAMPCTVMDMYKSGLCGGMSYVALWTRVQNLYDCGWVHIKEYQKHPQNGQYQTIYGAGPGEDARMPDDDVFRDTLPKVVINPNRKANPFDALLGYGT